MLDLILINYWGTARLFLVLEGYLTPTIDMSVCKLCL